MDESGRPPSGHLIESVQDTIGACLPNSGYVERYQSEETGYWSCALDWIDQMPQQISVLDVGCAYGTLALYTRKRLDAKVLAIDAIEQKVIRDLLNSSGISYAGCNIELEAIPSTRRFDLVICTETIEHFNFAPVPTLAKLYAALKPGGALIISTPDANSAWGRMTKYYTSLDHIPQPTPGRQWIDAHIWHYTKTEMTYVLEQAGFCIEVSCHSSRQDFRHLNILARRRVKWWNWARTER